MMKNLLLLSISLFFLNTNFAQISYGGEPISKSFIEPIDFQGIMLEKVEQQWITEAAKEDGKNGTIERVAKNIATNLNPYNSGTWQTLMNGDRIWRLKITAKDAKGINALFKNFQLAKGSKLYIYSPNYKQVLGAFTEKNNDESKLFSTEIILGNALILEYIEPKNQAFKGFFTIEKVGSFYKQVTVPNIDIENFGDSDPCEVNINCSPEGTNWQDEKRGVARILVVVPNGQGWCSGTLVNNTNADCKPYFLTAWHCGDNSTTSNFNQWVFYFNFEFSTCSGSSTAPSYNSMTGASVKARSINLTSSGGSSDFLLLELNQNVPTNYNVYYNGWNRSSSPPPSGVSIHHPAGDVKKISTFNSSPSTLGVSWSGVNYATISGSTHWNLSWAGTTNGHGVTEGGSSGSPLFDNNGFVIGTLSGGSSGCSNQNGNDQYGKFSYHWQSNASANNRRLKPWLDPTNSGVTTLAGTYSPCAPASNHDAGITNIISPDGNICSATITPEVTLKNFGSTNLTTVTINYQVNSGAVSTYSWSGNLNQNATTNVSLPNISPTAGTSTFTAFTTSPNNGSDGNLNNNSKTDTFTLNSLSTLPVQENFEGTIFPPTDWTIFNPDNSNTWEHSTTIGTGSGTKSMFIDNWDYNAPNQLDWFVSETYDFSSVNNPTLTYDYAYAYYDQTGGSGLSYDTLGIAASINCGASFFWLWKEGGTQLATAGGLGTAFIPTSGDWQNNSLDLSSLIGESSVQFAIIAKNGYGNNLYIDNININSMVIPTPPVAAFTANTTSICVGESIDFTDQTTNNPASWSWSFGGGAPSSTNRNPTVTFNTAGTYTISLTATNNDGSDIEVKTNYVTVHSKPTLTFNTNDVSCFGGSDGEATAIANGNGGYSYNWSGISGNNATITGLTANTYSCTVTDINNCTVSGSTTVSQASAISASANTTTAYCMNANGSVTFSASGGTPPYTYTVNGNNQSSSTFNNLSPGNYVVTIKDANLCTHPLNFSIANTVENFTATIQTTNTSCTANTGTAFATINGTSTGYTFLWDNGQNTPSASNLSFGNHTVDITNSNGCTETSNFYIANLNAPIVSIQTSDALCFGENTGSATATISGGTPSYNISWSTGGNALVENSIGAGNHTITVTDNASCITVKNFTINEPEAIAISFTPINEHCDKSDGKITANVIGGTPSYTYSWSNGATGNIINNLEENAYTLTITDGNNCTAFATQNLQNIESPTASNVLITNIDCANENNGSILLDVVNGTGVITNSWSNGANTEDLVNVPGGDYTLHLEDEFNCSSDTTLTIFEPEPLELGLTIVDNSPNSTSSISTNVSGGISAYTYIWSNGATSESISNLSIGTYTITVTDAKGCQIDSTINIGNVAIENTTFIEIIHLYPNPSKDVLNLDILLKNRNNIKINIYNTLGQNLFSENLNSITKISKTIDIAKYTNGVYYVAIEIENSKEIIKFLKID